MHKHSDTILIVACLVFGLMALSVHATHPGILPAGWANTCGRSVSLTYAVHMAELEFRRVTATVGRFVSFT
jgi:hypothetical protein